MCVSTPVRWHQQGEQRVPRQQVDVAQIRRAKVAAELRRVQRDKPGVEQSLLGLQAYQGGLGHAPDDDDYFDSLSEDCTCRGRPSERGEPGNGRPGLNGTSTRKRRRAPSRRSRGKAEDDAADDDVDDSPAE